MGTAVTKQELTNDIASFIGEGVHTALRKCCDSAASTRAWNAISELPPEEWSACTRAAAEVIVDWLVDEGHITLQAKRQKRGT